MALLSSSSSEPPLQLQHVTSSLAAPTTTADPELFLPPPPQLRQWQQQLQQQQQQQPQQPHQKSISRPIDPTATIHSNTARSLPSHNNRMTHPPLPHEYLHHQQQQLAMQQRSNMLLQQQQLQQRQHQIMWMQQQQQQQQLQQRLALENATKVSEKVSGHEGMVQPATIRELSDAWVEAVQTSDVTTTTAATRNQNEEYDDAVIGANFDELALAWETAQLELQDEIDDLTNLWAGENLDANAYQFQNTALPLDLVTHNKNKNSTESTSTNTTTTTDWMEEGYREFHAGNMTAAIQAFEMELQQMDMDNATAWCMLGKCHAENDMDALAIQCLEEAVNRDPYSMDALLSLGVSYVNELNHVAALQNLKEWILHNPKFANLDVNGRDDLYAPSTTATTTTIGTSTDAAFDEVQRLLLSALDYQMQHNRNDQNMTASVLEALGVVYNVSRDYDAAIDVLQQSCALRPHDYQLWNKLGATLANSGTERSEEALSAYHQALQIKPKYARAWLNMAIAHSNLQQYDDAARCYLQTLSINPNAEHCWSFLRIALTCIERDDLLPAATAHNLDAFKGDFDFVTYNDSR